jgi:hypothetical protein
VAKVKVGKAGGVQECGDIETVSIVVRPAQGKCFEIRENIGWDMKESTKSNVVLRL